MTIKRTAQKDWSNLTLKCYAKPHSDWKNANTLFPSYLKGYFNPNLYWNKQRSANHKSKNFKLHTRWDYRTSLYQTYCVFVPFSFVKNLNKAKHSSSLFFKEISKNGTRSHGRMFASAKKSNESRFDSYSVRKSALIISHITFRDCRLHSFSDNLSRNSCVRKAL